MEAAACSLAATRAFSALAAARLLAVALPFSLPSESVNAGDDHDKTEIIVNIVIKKKSSRQRHTKLTLSLPCRWRLRGAGMLAPEARVAMHSATARILDFMMMCRRRCRVIRNSRLEPRSSHRRLHCRLHRCAHD